MTCLKCKKKYNWTKVKKYLFGNDQELFAQVFLYGGIRQTQIDKILGEGWAFKPGLIVTACPRCISR